MDGQTVEETTSATSTQQKVELTQDVLKDIWKQVNNSDAGEDAEYTADRVFLNEVPFGNTEVKVFRIDDGGFRFGHSVQYSSNLSKDTKISRKMHPSATAFSFRRRAAGAVPSRE